MKKEEYKERRKIKKRRTWYEFSEWEINYS